MAAWALGRTSPKKRIHRADCKYARVQYVWAGNRSEDELFDELCRTGAFAWHDAGQCCCYDLDDSLYQVRRLAGLES